ncbi:glycosyltransferase [Microbacterium sp. NPDC087665]|uniref:glycosyltransferase n=1 Tax=Microbacterium sp. NPDC087665 TaxID=3364194 RepID=UPI003805E49F
MRALISTFGTRGDVEPYAALAERRKREGHDVTLSAPEAYREDLERRGIGFEPMGDAMHAAMRALMGRRTGTVRSRGGRPADGTMRLSLTDQWAVAQTVEPTIIVSHPQGAGRNPHRGTTRHPVRRLAPASVPHPHAGLRHPVLGAAISWTRQSPELSVQPIHGRRVRRDDQSGYWRALSEEARHDLIVFEDFVDSRGAVPGLRAKTP